MHNIYITNLADHDQEFEVHGWNNKNNLKVNPGTTAAIGAEDGSAGAVIALHGGHEGEQAEITKDGFGGNDFIDLSNIVGAGGNLTVQQVNNPATRKGDPRFMQHLNEAWQRAGDNTKASLSECVHLDNSGNVSRIDAIKDFPALEEFVRSFADGMTYIGVGAWGGSPGNANDNNQSSAGQGNTDIQVTYNDGDASPPQVAFHHSQFAVTKRDETIPGPGILLTNRSSKQQDYNFYDNFWNGDGTAGANFDQPSNPTTLQPGETTFVGLPKASRGAASDDGGAHGDVSLEQGCDGAATISATDGSDRTNGFSHDVLSDAPEAAILNKPDGSKALATTMGNWMSGPNQATIDYLNQVVGQHRAYMGGTGTDDVASSNKCLAVDFY
ncbi:hypothetical protein MMC30_008997 [Trapelia coarctata]|nr:hypothetical protein [Trapelia coarctata]